MSVKIYRKNCPPPPPHCVHLGESNWYIGVRSRIGYQEKRYLVIDAGISPSVPDSAKASWRISSEEKANNEAMIGLMEVTPDEVRTFAKALLELADDFESTNNKRDE